MVINFNLFMRKIYVSRTSGKMCCFRIKAIDPLENTRDFSKRIFYLMLVVLGEKKGRALTIHIRERGFVLSSPR